MSLISRGQRAADQPAGVAVVTAGQQMGYFKDISAAAGVDEMKGPQSGGRRPETTGNRGGVEEITVPVAEKAATQEGALLEISREFRAEPAWCIWRGGRQQQTAEDQGRASDNGV